MIDWTKIEDGTAVTLTKDVKNPKPDRRSRHDWRLQEVIPKGTKLVVKRYAADSEHLRAGSIELRPVTTWTHQHLSLNLDGTLFYRASFVTLTQAMLPHLEAAGETLGTIATANYMQRDHVCVVVVERLLKDGKLSLAEVKAMVNDWTNSPEED